MRDWERIALGDAVITGLERGHYDTVVVYGHLLGGPFAAVLDPERGVQVLDVPGSDPVSSAAVSEQIELATADGSRLPATTAKTYGCSSADRSGAAPAESTAVAAPRRDRPGSPPHPDVPTG